MTPGQLQDALSGVSAPRYAVAQVCDWLYRKRVDSISAMSNLSKGIREALDAGFEPGWTRPVSSVTSVDGTVKYFFEIPSGQCGGESAGVNIVEAVVIPDGDRRTLCISTQAGCRMGCRFCMTGRGGWHGNLDAAQILSQIVAIPESELLTNVVFMGMGEPLDNYDTLSTVLDCLTSDWGFGWSPKRITVSTIGVLPNLKRLLDEHKCHIAVSLHNPFPEERESMMPSQKVWPILDTVRLLKQYDFSGQRRVSFEYTMFAGFNDSRRHADALLRLLKPLECRINLIRFHKIPDFPYETSSPGAIELFKERLCAGGITTTLRSSRGEDIYAACGLLAGKYNGKI